MERQVITDTEEALNILHGIEDGEISYRLVELVLEKEAVRTVKDLKRELNGLPDDMPVVISRDEKGNGYYYSVYPVGTSSVGMLYGMKADDINQKVAVIG